MARIVCDGEIGADFFAFFMGTFVGAYFLSGSGGNGIVRWQKTGLARKLTGGTSKQG